MRAVHNARVLTMQDPTTTATALLWDQARILAVGDDATVRRAAKQHGIDSEDLDGRIVLPGFVDAHTHFLHVGVKHRRADLRSSRDLDDALARTEAWMAAHEGPVIAEGWDETTWKAATVPTREDLDALSTERPIVLRRICGHTAVANSAALPPLRDRWDDDRVDLATGLLTEEPSLYLNEVLAESPEQLDAAVGTACDIAHKLGVTAVGEYCQAPYLDALRRAAAADRLTVRTVTSIYTQQLETEIQQGFRTGRQAPGPDGPSAWLQDGGLKVFLDGSLGGHTALLRQPYDDAASTGLANWTLQEATSWFDTAHRNRIQVHAHAIGDGAIDLGLAAFDAAVGGPSDLYHRFEHYEIVHDEQVQETARLGIVASSQPNFVGVWSAAGGMYNRRLGDRYLLNNRFQTFKRHGVRVAFGSDGMPFGPLRGLHSAIHHPVAAERMTLAEAIWHYTHEAAWSLHLPATGWLHPGNRPDLIILDQRRLDTDPLSWTIQETITGGRTRVQNNAPWPEDA